MMRTILPLLALAGALVYLGFSYSNARAKRQTARVAALTATAVAAQPLIVAIDRYQQKRNAPPSNLAALVPSYLARIPDAGPAAKAGWTYQVDMNNGEWSLRIDVRDDLSPNMWLGFGDTFEYRPGGKYPREAYGGIHMPFGQWAYYVE